MNEVEAPVVRSLLENDLYKFLISSPCCTAAPLPMPSIASSVAARRHSRWPSSKDDVERQLDRLCTMVFAQDELDYLSELRFIKSDFVDFLSYSAFSAAADQGSGGR